MRLIDAGLLLDNLSGRLESMKDYDAIKDVVKNMQTAYDLCKVVEQLEEMMLEIKDQLMYTRDENMAVRLRCKMHGLDAAIEIVKGGGVNE